MDGWFCLHRKILDNPVVCKDAEHLAVWIYLLANATYTEYDMFFNGKRITLNPGQLITGRKSISEKLKINESKVQRILKLFENEQQIEQQTTSQNRLITILNWNKYQINEQQNEQQMNNERTTNEQRLNTNNNIINKKNNNNDIDDGNIKKENDSCDDGFQKIINFYQENIGILTPFGLQLLQSYYDDGMNEEIIIFAMKKAVTNNSRNINYIKAILNNWSKKGVKTLIDAKNEDLNFKRNKNTSKKDNKIRNNTFSTDWDIIYDELMKNKGDENNAE